jgi:hypothetical protein
MIYLLIKHMLCSQRRDTFGAEIQMSAMQVYLEGIGFRRWEMP